MLFTIQRLFVVFSLVLTVITASYAQARTVIIPAPPELSARAYLLVDAKTGKVIVEHNADEQLPPASLTKMMTSYIVSEEIAAGRLSDLDLVRISDDAWRRGGAASGSSTMFLNPRTEVPVIDLLRGVIIQSGNDASIALAQHIAGSEEAFADIMNQQAAFLGMKNSHFVNATGWPAEGHITTAKDLSILATAVINDHPEHYSIYSEKYFKYNGINQPNRNKLLFTNKYVDGLKTGHTNEAGFCLVASAKQDDMRLVSVVMGTNSEKVRAAESQRLLAYGFRYYETHQLYGSDDTVDTVKVWAGTQDQLALGVKKPLVMTIPKGSYKSLDAKTHVDSVIKAPITEGQVLGKLVVSLDDEVIAQSDLVAMNGVTEAGIFSRLIDNIVLMFQGSGSSEAEAEPESE
ncbi:D-alanyl-D-alanine carboxypeptidase family protein [Teredinibacter sp. KSP-S5-2]|uniref:D-alanyl-D-alanine carboxypeptidase family protein n=1 Tax=Teredinibacter sp. KSP-S5-2 TaxID=3034506 RepID=UPI0029350142|nr:D-alanyl-D-alanine carboxypeptidase family protein [Teredinibacter sp. KSP-S5-2]WNO09508.1 D-alanyl-D-alanine carboxypeptidase [Teredinibacter sp. KSP-S5-2]